MKQSDKTTSTNLKVHLIVLSGDAEFIQEHIAILTGSAEVTATQLDEKAIIRFREMFRLVRNTPKNSVLCFGCKDLEVQRYQFVLKSYLLLGRARRRFLIDEQGTKIEFGLPGYFFSDVPRFVVELFASALVIVVVYIRLLLLRSTLSEKKTRE